MLVWLVTGLFSGWFSNALLSPVQFPGEKPKEMKNFALDARWDEPYSADNG
jgi:hypothetical protein